MSKKVLNYAGKRPMLLALIIMATVTLGLLFSGWLTPTPGKAQAGGGNPPPNNEATDCVQSSVSTNCSEGTVTFSSVTVNPAIGCIGSGMSASVPTPTITAGQMIVDTSYTNANPNATNTTCDDTYTTNTPSPSPAYTWTVSGPGSFSASGSGLSASFTPTNCGSGTITFTAKWTDTCDTNQSSTSTSGNFQADAVTSLTPSAGTLVDDGDNDPNTATYLVQYGCYNTITVTAGDCLDLDSSMLPTCWQVVANGNATQVTKKYFIVDTTQVGKTIIIVTCGTSYKIITLIVYQAKIEIDADKGTNNWYDVGHSWWNLTINLAEAEALIPNNLKDDLGMAGFWPAGGYNYKGSIMRGDQGHTATGSYWFCISFDTFRNTLIYVDNLYQNPPWYILPTQNCTTVAEGVLQAAGIPNPGFYTPWGLSGQLNDWDNAGAPQCRCQNF